MPDTEVVRTLLACLVLGKERLPGFMTTDLRHYLTSIHAMDRSVGDLGDQGQGVVAGALTLYAARASFFVMIFTFRIWSSTYPPALPKDIDSWICLCGDGLEVPKHPVNQSVGVVAV